MHLVFLAYLIVSISFALVSLSAMLPQCYPNQADFNTACKTILNGTVDGGRCFFVGGKNKNWTTAWTACAQYGAQLAHIHTEGEFLKVSSYLAVVLGSDLPGYGLVALYDAISPRGTNTCVIHLENSRWYDNAIDYKPKLTAGNTWIRYHQCDVDYWRENPPKPFVIYSPSAGSYGFGDAREAYAGATYFNALCQYNNQAQTFEKTTYCLTETPIATAPAANPYECAQECGGQGWCRGYNYEVIGNSYMCLLFTWSVYDTCPKCASKVSANSTCTYYNYVA